MQKFWYDLTGVEGRDLELSRYDVNPNGAGRRKGELREMKMELVREELRNYKRRSTKLGNANIFWILFLFIIYIYAIY